MNYRSLYLLLGFTALVSLAQEQVSSPADLAKSKVVQQTWTPPRMPDGRPDFQGVWVNNGATPLERPKELAGRALLTDAELSAMKNKARELFGGAGDAAFGDTVFEATLANVLGTRTGFKSTDGTTGDYSSVWTVERDWDQRTSLITDPPDGRMPALTPEGQKRRAFNRTTTERRAAGPEDRLLQERCITYGSPSLVAGYQSGYQIVQTANSVAIETEMIHDSRLLPLNAGPHLPSSVRQWLGDSRARWEGDALVVDTTNYKPRSFMGISSEKLHVTERFSRTEPEFLQYSITIDDPDTWTKPWSLMIRLRKADHPLYEYACHEGNYGMEGILAGARAEDRAAAGR